MSKDRKESYPDYPIFKGLQSPLEFMGVQGRYIYWAAGTIGAAIAGFIIGYCIVGFILGLSGYSISNWNWTHLIKAKERPTHETEQKGHLHICLFKEDLRKKPWLIHG